MSYGFTIMKFVLNSDHSHSHYAKFLFSCFHFPQLNVSPFFTVDLSIQLYKSLHLISLPVILMLCGGTIDISIV